MCTPCLTSALPWDYMSLESIGHPDSWRQHWLTSQRNGSSAQGPPHSRWPPRLSADIYFSLQQTLAPNTFIFGFIFDIKGNFLLRSKYLVWLGWKQSATRKWLTALAFFADAQVNWANAESGGLIEEKNVETALWLLRAKIWRGEI